MDDRQGARDINFPEGFSSSMGTLTNVTAREHPILISIFSDLNH